MLVEVYYDFDVEKVCESELTQEFLDDGYALEEIPTPENVEDYIDHTMRDDTVVKKDGKFYLLK